MKMGIISVLVLLILIILLNMFNIYLETSVNNMIKCVELSETYIKAKKYDESYKKYLEAKEIWNDKEIIFQLQIEHTDLDNINKVFDEINSYFKTKEYNDYWKATNTLSFLLKHMVSNNKVNLETIF